MLPPDLEGTVAPRRTDHNARKTGIRRNKAAAAARYTPPTGSYPPGRRQAHDVLAGHYARRPALRPRRAATPYHRTPR